MRMVIWPVLLISLISIGLTEFKSPGKSYVCIPCGLECDNTVYYTVGTCKVCGMNLVETGTINFKNLDFEQLCNRIKTNKEIVLLDVRSKEEFTNSSEEIKSFGKFRNAININVNELETRISELEKFKNREVVVYCSHSHRSPQASYFLSTHGFNNVENVSGGVSKIEISDLGCLKDYYISFAMN